MAPGTGVFGHVGVTIARGSDGSLWSWGALALGGGGSGADPGQIPRIPPVTNQFGTWFGAVS